MANKAITLIIGAKNAIASGLSSAVSGIANFGKQAKAIWSTIWAPASLAFAVTAAVKKIVDMIDGALGQIAARQNELKKGNFEAHLNLVSQAIEAQKKAYDELSKSMAANAKHQKDMIGLLAEQEASENKLATLKAMLGKSSEDRADIEARAEQEQKVTDALQEQTRAQMDQAEAQKALEANTARRAEIADDITAAEKEYAAVSMRRQKAIAVLEKWSDRSTGGQYRASFFPAMTEAIKVLVKNFDESGKKAFDVLKNLRDQERQYAEESKQLAAKKIAADQARANSAKHIEVVKAENINQIDAESTKQSEIETRKRQDAEEESLDALFDKFADDAAKRKKIEKDLADEQKRIAKDVLEAKKDALDKELQKAKDVAKKTVQEVIDEARKEEKEKTALMEERKRGSDLAAKERRGIKLSRRDREWARAFREREAAVGAAAKLPVEIQKAQEQIKAIEKSGKTLDDIKKALDKNLTVMQQIMAAG